MPPDNRMLCLCHTRALHSATTVKWTQLLFFSILPLSLGRWMNRLLRCDGFAPFERIANDDGWVRGQWKTRKSSSNCFVDLRDDYTERHASNDNEEEEDDDDDNALGNVKRVVIINTDIVSLQQRTFELNCLPIFSQLSSSLLILILFRIMHMMIYILSNNF